MVGAWPAEPELVHRTNLADLTAMAGPMAGVVPERAGQLDPGMFRVSAPSWLASSLYGTLDPADWSGAGDLGPASPDKSPPS